MTIAELPSSQAEELTPYHGGMIEEGIYIDDILRQLRYEELLAEEQFAGWMHMHEWDGECMSDGGHIVEKANQKEQIEESFRSEDGFSRWQSKTIKDSTKKDENIGMGFTLTTSAARALKSKGYEEGLVPDSIKMQAAIDRAIYLDQANSPEIIQRIYELESEMHDTPVKKQLFLAYLEKLKIHGYKNKNGMKEASNQELFKQDPVEIPGMGSFAYKTRYSPENISRRELNKKMILSKIGKHIRSPICMAPMPHTSGSLDAITTAAMSNSLAIIPRNYQFADPTFQIDFAKSVVNHLKNFDIPKLPHEESKECKEYKDRVDMTKKVWLRNVGAAIGVGHGDIQRFKDLYDAGVKTFRLYTVATDPHLRTQLKRFIDEVKAIGDDDIEIFIGQMTSGEQVEDMVGNKEKEKLSKKDLLKKQADDDPQQLENVMKKLDKDDWKKYIAGVYIGNGGGSVCSTATTGMAVNSVELVSKFRNHKLMKDKSIIVEGGMNSEPLPWVFGADGLSYASELMGVERPGGKMCIKDKQGKCYTIYSGEASAMAKDTEKLIDAAGHPVHVEGQLGVRELKLEQASVTRVYKRLNEYLAQVLVKCGAYNDVQLHSLGTLCTAKEMDKIWGNVFTDKEGKKIPDGWRNIPDVYEINNTDELAKYIRKITKAPKRVSDKTILKRYGVTKLDKPYYIIPHPIEHRSLQVAQEGRPYGGA